MTDEVTYEVQDMQNPGRAVARCDMLTYDEARVIACAFSKSNENRPSGVYKIVSSDNDIMAFYYNGVMFVEAGTE